MAEVKVKPGPLHLPDTGFLSTPCVKRILTLTGWAEPMDPVADHDHTGLRAGDPVEGTRPLWIEPAPLGLPGPGAAPFGLMLDQGGPHLGSSRRSDLEQLLATAPLDDTALLDRARAAMTRLKRYSLSQSNDFDPDLPVPDPGYILVLDQPRKEPAIKEAAASSTTFREALTVAQIENPNRRIVIKTAPGVGHYGPDDVQRQITLCDRPVSPWRLLEGAVAVYTVSADLGFEAILSGHKPRVFGQPFYSGWGLTEDENPVPRRTRNLTRAQMFAASMILYPVWYDPLRDRLCEIEQVIDTLATQVRPLREDAKGYVAVGISPDKHGLVTGLMGNPGPVKMVGNATEAVDMAMQTDRPVLAWQSQTDEALEAATAMARRPLIRVGPGFLRPSPTPLSLLRDDLGHWNDPREESRLERLIAAAADLPEADLRRAERVTDRLRAIGLFEARDDCDPDPDLPGGQRILILGEGGPTPEEHGRLTDQDLLYAARERSPDAVLVYRPKGGLVDEGLRDKADVVLTDYGLSAAIDAVEEVWTIAAPQGLEVLLRQTPVTCLGLPFYAGWGLTRDLSECPARRGAQPDLRGLIHAALIDYPRYQDQISGQPCPIEVVLDQLQT
ncbi:capsular polysaccharide biosynthesis protein [Actibacterium sp. 188UL27-1]|uniref:capsular polysaccharide biosynthesis protein n=1 Tax=Actibacterium sp. 188UL27-1 TaxID=2786961 RepID=UPI00195CDA44|nr:capsular polysaccharide biosynthesis protein [Actibacterium sp. 188UL27-1]MBM7068459.1 capsular polysaccharide biosynthesis protein [Actibacterium sp. 188UL27-1]